MYIQRNTDTNNHQTYLRRDGEGVLRVNRVCGVDGGAHDVLAAREQHEGLGHRAPLGRRRRRLLAVRARTFRTYGKDGY